MDVFNQAAAVNSLVPPDYAACRPVPSALYAIVDQLLTSYGQAVPEERAQFRANLSFPAKVMLQALSWEFAATGVNQQSADTLVTAMTVLIIGLDAPFVDFRDALLSLEVMYRSARKLRIDEQGLFERMAAQATNENLQGLLRRYATDPQLRPSEAIGERNVDGNVVFLALRENL